MATTAKIRRRYRIFAYGQGWCILGNQGTRWWVSDDVYFGRHLAAVQAAYQRSVPAHSDRDWFEVGMWEMPADATVEQAIEEALRRLKARKRRMARHV
jgi:hypothetical protein